MLHAAWSPSAALAEQGFEILELTCVFDDIMSAPARDTFNPPYFKLIIEALRTANSK